MGETNKSFTATANGNYAVEITQDSCTDTSACYAVTSIGILENDFGPALRVYPNPTTGKLIIELGQTFTGVILSIRNLRGQLINKQNFETAKQLDIEIEGPSAYYLIGIKTSEGKTALLKVLKE